MDDRDIFVDASSNAVADNNDSDNDNDNYNEEEFHTTQAKKQNNNKNNNKNNNSSSSSSSPPNGFSDPTLALALTLPAHRHHSQRSRLLTLAFNQDGGCLAVGTENGFTVHDLHPEYKLGVERSLKGGIGRIEMLFRCNLMALVGGGTEPHAAPHRVLIWDDNLTKEIGELSFRQVVLRVLLRKDHIGVALFDRVYVYKLADLSLRDKIFTANNPCGLLSLSTHVKDMVLACPSSTEGHVRVELYGMRKTMLIPAHESTLRALKLTADGSKLATASHKGTIVRVFDVATAQKIYEFRRGVERANINCIAFSSDDQWIACSSDKGTTHIFYLDNHNNNNSNSNSNKSAEQQQQQDNQQQQQQKKKTGYSLLSSGSKLLGRSLESGSKMLLGSLSSSSSYSYSYSSSPQKSVCQIRGVPHPLACAFLGDAPNRIAVAGWDADGNGVLLISEFAAGQEARRISYIVLVKNAQTADESEDQQRRRRARGWVPGGSGDGSSSGNGNRNRNSSRNNDQQQRASLSEDDARTHFGHLRISDQMAEESHLFQTQTTEDDFCEVIVRPIPIREPFIEDKPPPLPSPPPPPPANRDRNRNRTVSTGDASTDKADAASSTGTGTGTGDASTDKDSPASTGDAQQQQGQSKSKSEAENGQKNKQDEGCCTRCNKDGTPFALPDSYVLPLVETKVLPDADDDGGSGGDPTQ